MTKFTKLQKVDFIRKMISTDPQWALRGMLRIYEHQTAEEQNFQSTIESNGIGFSGIDANILSGIVDFYSRTGFITKKQTDIVLKKMKKYATQLYSMCDQAKLEKTMEKANA